VSLMELAAFVCWHRHKVAAVRSRSSKRVEEDSDDEDLQEDWDMMDGGDKAEWVPEEPRASLAAENDLRWLPLLAEGRPPCVPGSPPVPPLGPLRCAASTANGTQTVSAAAAAEALQMSGPPASMAVARPVDTADAVAASSTAVVQPEMATTQDVAPTASAPRADIQATKSQAAGAHMLAQLFAGKQAEALPAEEDAESSQEQALISSRRGRARLLANGKRKKLLPADPVRLAIASGLDEAEAEALLGPGASGKPGGSRGPSATK
ncbi:unnamed protein product, partial [Polarella glacialis]